MENLGERVILISAIYTYIPEKSLKSREERQNRSLRSSVTVPPDESLSPIDENVII